MFKVLLREMSFAKAIRISTLPTRLSSLASGASMVDIMVTDSGSFSHGSLKSFGLNEYGRWEDVSFGHPNI